MSLDETKLQKLTREAVEIWKMKPSGQALRLVGWREQLRKKVDEMEVEALHQTVWGEGVDLTAASDIIDVLRQA